MEVKPPVAIAIIVVAVVLIGLAIWKFGVQGGMANRKPPPIVSGLSGGGPGLDPNAIKRPPGLGGPPPTGQPGR